MARIAGDDDGRHHAAAAADIPLPGRQPLEGLERRAVGVALKILPKGSYRGEIVVDGQFDAVLQRSAQLGAWRRQGNARVVAARCQRKIGQPHFGLSL
jgi:hypothetical protein